MTFFLVGCFSIDLFTNLSFCSAKDKTDVKITIQFGGKSVVDVLGFSGYIVPNLGQNLIFCIFVEKFL